MSDLEKEERRRVSDLAMGGGRQGRPVHYVLATGEHQEAVLFRETEHGARMEWESAPPETHSDGNVSRVYTVVVAVQRDEATKAPGTWHEIEA